MGIIGTFEGSASNPLWLYNGSNSLNGWNNKSPTLVNYGRDHSSAGWEVMNQGGIRITPWQNGKVIWVLYRFVNNIILTPYHTLHWEVSTYLSGYTPAELTIRVGVGSPSMTGNAFSSAVNPTVNTAKGGGIAQATYSINISNLSGTYCIYVYMYVKGSSTFNDDYFYMYSYKAWLD